MRLGMMIGGVVFVIVVLLFIFWDNIQVFLGKQTATVTTLTLEDEKLKLQTKNFAKGLVDELLYGSFFFTFLSLLFSFFTFFFPILAYLFLREFFNFSFFLEIIIRLMMRQEKLRPPLSMQLLPILL